MKKLSFFILLCFSALALLSARTQAANILVFGDSLSAGYGLQTGEEWPALLQQRLQAKQLGHYQVVNTSISGETSAGGLARFAATFDKYKPAIVILELGANDGLRGLPLALMRKNLAAMIAYSRQHQAQVLLVDMQIPPNYGKRYTSEFQQSFVQLQKDYGISGTGFLLEALAGQPELIQKDGLHPTAEAQPLLLDTVWKSLHPMLQTRQ